MRIVFFIVLLSSVYSFGQKKDTTDNNSILKSEIQDTILFIDGHIRKLIKNEFKITPDLVFSTTSKDPFYKTGLSFDYNFRFIGKKGFNWYGIVSPRFGITNQGSIPYFSDPQTRAFYLKPLNDSLFGQPSYSYIDLYSSINLNYKAIRFIIGMSRPSIGFSERSIFSSNSGINNPFINLNIRFNKLFSYSLRQDFLREKIGGHFEPKGNVTHSFTYDHKGDSKFQARLFETVVYQMKDTLYNRGFEVEYLNPFLFFRPQEYNMGSADNILLGGELQYVLGKNKTLNSIKYTKVYTQILFDDFLLSALKAKNGWWANKYGFNIGLSVNNNVNGYEGIAKKYTIEFTYMRPYVFSQTNPGIVYGNQGLPISHPLGSNFAEVYQRFYFHNIDKNFSIDAFLQAYIKGVDSTGLKVDSYGGDIYKSYSKHPYEFNNKVGQGVTLRSVQLGTRFSFISKQKKYIKSLVFYIEPRYRMLFFENHRQTDFFLSIGIQSLLLEHKDRLNY